MTGTIYMISSPNTDKVYIGSTIQKLIDRFSLHKAVSNDTRSRIIIESGDAVITAIDSIEDEDKEELKIKELEYIQLYKDICVNIKGTKDSYSKEYKSPGMLDGRKKEQQNTKNDCCICGGKYTNKHKVRHFKSAKHISKL
jgi:exosome complex RNA-binding protein Rrp4